MLNATFKTGERTTQRARELRARQTKAEKLLWKRLRGKRFQGLKFRRQVAMNPYIADFLCVEHRLIVEVDGGVHFEEANKNKDIRRQRYFEQKGFSVVRFTNTTVRENMEHVLQTIAEKCGISSDPSP